MEIHKHYILHKPYGFLSQFVSFAPKNHRQKFLGELHDFVPGTMAIGRLDEKSEGLILLTTDGKMSNEILSRKFEKEYYVQLDGIITDQAIAELRKGVRIGIRGVDYITQKAAVKKIEDPGFENRSQKIRDERHGPTSWASICISEGKNRQVRKMCAAVNFPVLRLVRVRIGDILLNDLKVGEVREIKQLINS